MKRSRTLLRIGLKYCGGCHPRFDRIETLERIKHNLAGKVEFVSNDSGNPDLVLVISGCLANCADVSSFDESKIRVVACERDAEIFIKEIISITDS